MTWTYDSGATALGRVRLMVGDTVSTDQLISDEEIGLYLSGGALAQPTETLSAAKVADVLAGIFSRRVDMSSGSSSVTMSQQVEHYRRLARELRRQAATETVPYVGGVSLAAKDAIEDDADRVVPAFTRAGGDPVEVTW